MTTNRFSKEVSLIIMSIVISFFAVGCTAPKPVPAPTIQYSKVKMKKVPGILVIYGEPLIQQVDGTKISAFMFTVSSRFSERLNNSLQVRGIPTQEFVFRDKNADAKYTIAKLLKENRRDGIIQISVFYQNNNGRIQLVIAPVYNKLKFHNSGDATVGNGITDRFIVFDDKDYRMAQRSLSKLADTFAQRIYDAYYRNAPNDNSEEKPSDMMPQQTPQKEPRPNQV